MGGGEVFDGRKEELATGNRRGRGMRQGTRLAESNNIRDDDEAILRFRLVRFKNARNDRLCLFCAGENNHEFQRSKWKRWYRRKLPEHNTYQLRRQAERLLWTRDEQG
ncbi:hypothetical protein R6Q59_016543 [Mikania micrantha]